MKYELNIDNKQKICMKSYSKAVSADHTPFSIYSISHTYHLVKINIDRKRESIKKETKLPVKRC